VSGASCPICQTQSPVSGRIVHNSPAMVAGVEIDLDGTRFEMHRCPRCGLQFKHPFIPEDQLISCYEQASGDHWEETPDPLKRRFDDIERVINAHASGPKVLDIGCSNGALLGYMGQSWERSGIEPGQQAAEHAEQRGVRIIAPMLEQCETDERFDVVLAIDVLEHLLNPSDFIEHVRGLLSEDGIFVGFTGDTAARSWKWHGSRYWYASLPEHQVFYNKTTIDQLAQKLGFEVVHYERTSHARFKSSRRVRDNFRGVIWGIMMRLGMHKHASPPGWLPAKDHMLFAIKLT
jgi:SAM-dependent methyltransferase